MKYVDGEWVREGERVISPGDPEYGFFDSFLKEVESHNKEVVSDVPEADKDNQAD